MLAPCYLLLLLSSLCYLVSSEVSVTLPSYGTRFDLSSGSAVISVEWSINENPGPQKGEILEYIFTLVSGPNFNIEAFETVGKADAKQVEEQRFQFPLSNTVGADGWYYIQVMALTENGHTIQYSPRFQLIGMAGGRVPQLATEVQQPQRELRMTTLDILAGMNSFSFSVPYRSQRGLAKFAPMQTQPPTKVTKTAWSMQNPTSSVSYFKSKKRGREQLTTVTPGWSYGLPSEWNEAPAALHPRENGGWYHPSNRMSLTPRKINAVERFGHASE